MSDVKLRVERIWMEQFENVEGRKALHQQRSKLMHGLADSLDLQVKEWGETDSEYPREVVEIIVALGSAGVFTAMVAAFRSWLERDKIKDVEIEAPNGFKVRPKGASAGDVDEITRSLHLDGA